MTFLAVAGDLEGDTLGTVFALGLYAAGTLLVATVLPLLLPVPVLERLRILSSMRLKDSSCRWRFLEALDFSAEDGSRNAAIPKLLGLPFSGSLYDDVVIGFGKLILPRSLRHGMCSGEGWLKDGPAASLSLSSPLLELVDVPACRPLTADKDLGLRIPRRPFTLTSLFVGPRSTKLCDTLKQNAYTGDLAAVIKM